MASEKYASDIRKAGYVVPPDGAIRLDGGIDSIENKRRHRFENIASWTEWGYCLF